MFTLSALTHLALVRLLVLVLIALEGVAERNSTFSTVSFYASRHIGMEPVPFKIQSHLLFVWSRFRCDFTGECVHAAYLACMSCPSCKGTPYNWIVIPVDSDGSEGWRICVCGMIFTLHLCHCYYGIWLIASCLLMQSNNTANSRCWFCSVGDARLKRGQLFGDCLRNFTASWSRKPQENMFVVYLMARGLSCCCFF